jgi:Skp family chaperone for outer membrane proteins
MLRNRGILVIPMLGLLLGVFSGGAHAKGSEPKGQIPVFASVDLDRAFNNYDKKKKADEELASFVDGLKTKFQLKQANPLLTADEFNQLSDLSSKASPTPDEKKKLDQLIAESNRRVQEFQSLQQKPNASDVEKAQLAKYQSEQNDTNNFLSDENKKGMDQINSKQADMMKSLLGDIDVAISDLAKDRGYTMVFNKAAVNGAPSVVLYSGVDITDDVLKKLNKK